MRAQKNIIIFASALLVNTICWAQNAKKVNQELKSLNGTYLERDGGCLTIRNAKNGRFDFYSFIWGSGATGYTCSMSGSATLMTLSDSQQIFEYLPKNGDIETPLNNEDPPRQCYLKIHVNPNEIRFEDQDNGCSFGGEVFACGSRATLNNFTFQKRSISTRSCEEIQEKIDDSYPRPVINRPRPTG